MRSENDEALALIDQMPDGVSRETMITELQFRLTMLRRGEEAKRGERVISHDEAKQRLGKWLDFAGI